MEPILTGGWPAAIRATAGTARRPLPPSGWKSTVRGAPTASVARAKHLSDPALGVMAARSASRYNVFVHLAVPPARFAAG